MNLLNFLSCRSGQGGERKEAIAPAEKRKCYICYINQQGQSAHNTATARQRDKPQKFRYRILNIITNI